MTSTPSGLLALAIALSMGTASAQQTVFDPGKQEYSNNCAACHGNDGKGNGPMVEWLTKSPPDLSQLAKKNKGVLPISRLYTVIDGTGVPSHGSREMPVWGREYRIEDAHQFREARGHYDSAELVRARILALLEYLSRLQTP